MSSQSSKNKRRLKRYRQLGPWIKFFAHVLALLPLSFNHGIGAVIGWLSWRGRGASRRVAEANLWRCFPELAEHERARLLRRSLMESGKTLTEIAPLWLWPLPRILKKVRDVSGEEHLRAGLARGKGVIILAPHIGSWEFVGHYISNLHPMVNLFKPHPIPALSELMKKGRVRGGMSIVPTDARGVRTLLQTLKQGDIAGILPDQDPGAEGGEFAPFFGLPANTITLLSKLAHKSGATVILTYAERLPRGRGYRVHFSEDLAEVRDPDLAVSLAAINAAVERAIRALPEQYQWSYKRFKARPPGEESFY